MNRSYKVIWSKAKNCYVVASEFAKRHGKAPSKVLVAGVLSAVMAIGAMSPASAASVNYDDDSYETITLEGDVGVGTKITNLADGDVSAASMDAVTGAQLYAVQQQFDTFQSALSRNNSTIAAAQADINTLKTGYVTLNSTVNTLKTQVETGFNVLVGGAKVTNVNPETNYFNITAGDHMEITNDNGAVKFAVKADGEVAADNAGLVTGGTVYTEVRPSTDGNYVATAKTTGDNLLALDEQVKANADAIEGLSGGIGGLDGKANKDASNVADETAKWGAAIGTGAVAEGNGELVTGGTVYAETHPDADGEVIKAADSAGANLTALDNAVKDMKDGLDGKADTDLGNITDDGKGVIGDIAKESVKVIAGTNTTVTEGEDGAAKTYAVNVEATGRVAQGNEGLVDGGTVYDALQTTKGEIEQELEGYAKVDASNVGVNATTDNTEAWGEALGTGAVAEGDKKLVSGDTVYKALSDINVNADGAVAAGDTKAVSGDTMYTELRPEDGNVVKKDSTTAANLTALDTALGETQDAVEDINDALDNKANRDASNVAEHTADWGAAIGTGVVAEGNGELVTGGTVYAETHPNADGEFIKAADTAGANLTALDTAVKGLSDGMDGKADTDLGNITDDGKTVINNIAKDAVKVINGNTTTVTEGTDGDAKTYAVEINAGQIADGDTGYVTGGDIYNYIQDVTGGAVTPEDLEKKANVDASNVGANGPQDNDKAWGEALGTGAVEDGDGRLVTGDTVFDALSDLKADGTVAEGVEKAVSGGTVFSEVRPEDGNYVARDNTTGENLSALDTAVKAASDAVDEAKAGLDGKANVDASNVGVNGPADNDKAWGEALGSGEVAQGDVRLVSGDTVFNALQDLQILPEGQIAEGEKLAISGDTAFKELRPEDGNYIAKDSTTAENLTALDGAVKDAADAAAEAKEELDNKANKDASNVADYTADWGAAIGTGVVEEGNGELVTGGTVFAETRPVADGEFIKADSSAGENLTALDTAVKENKESIAEMGIDLANKANVDASNVTDADAWGAAIGIGAVEEGDGRMVSGDTVAKALKEMKPEGAIAEGEERAVSGGTVYTELRPEDGNYVAKDNTTAENLTALDDQVKANADNIENMKGELDGKANVDASNVAEHTAEWGAAIGTGVVETGNGELVTGGTVADALEGLKGEIADSMDNKADKDLGNITDEGKDAIKMLAKEAVTVSAGDYVVIEKTEAEGNVDYKVSVAMDGEVEAGNEGVVSGGQVADAISDAVDKVSDEMNDELAKKANKDASNIETEKWAEKLGTGEVTEGNTGLVNGGTVYEAIMANSNDLVDKEDGVIRIGGKAKHDDADVIDISKSTGEGRVLRGVVTDPTDLGSAANVGYVNGVANDLAKGMNSGLHKLDTKINKVGSQAAALAGLHPFEVDGDQRWNLAVGVGNYKGETSGAAGIFYRPSNRVMFNVASTVGDSDNMISGGVSIALDKGYSGMSKSAMANEIRALKADNEQMKRLVNMLVQKSTVMDELKAGFPDVPKNHWANNAVETLHGNGVLQGYPDGEFKGEKSMTRYEYAEMLYNAMKRGVEIPREIVREYQSEINQVAGK